MMTTPFGPAQRIWGTIPSTPFNRSVNLPQAINMYFNAVYYPNWRIYRQQPPSSLNVRFLSHIFYAFVGINQDGTIRHNDEHADNAIEVDGTNGCLKSLAALKKTNTILKCIVSVGGGGEGSNVFATIARDDKLCQRFALCAREFVDNYSLDGIDIDWEHPSNSQEGSDYIRLLSHLRQALPAPRYLLTTALPVGEWVLQHIDLAAAARILDLVNIMAYDYSGPWTEVAGHHANLFTSSSQAHGSSGDNGVEYMLRRGVPANKMLLGVPCYGRSFLQASGPGHKFSGSAGEEGTFEYRDLPRPGTTEQVDRAVGAAYCMGGDGGFVTYDNPETVRMKAEYVKRRGLAGLFYWTGTGDAEPEDRSLVKAGYLGLHSI